MSNSVFEVNVLAEQWGVSACWELKAVGWTDGVVSAWFCLVWVAGKAGGDMKESWVSFSSHRSPPASYVFP